MSKRVIFDMGRSQVPPVEWCNTIMDPPKIIDLLKAVQEFADHKDAPMVPGDWVRRQAVLGLRSR